MGHSVTYEHPLNERVRNLLRLELLLRQARHCHSAETSWDSRLFVATLIDILAVLSRSDLKTEIIKEAERQQTCIARAREKSGASQSEIANTLKELESLRTDLYAKSGPLGQELRENEFLTSIRQRSTIPGGTCDFDLPVFHQWLCQPPDMRKADQHRWLESLNLACKGIELLLRIIRGTARSSDEIGAAGGYQRNLETDIPYQLLRVTIDAEFPCFVEISGGKHRFTVRFMERTSEGRPQQTSRDVPFRLDCCAL